MAKKTSIRKSKPSARRGRNVVVEKGPPRGSPVERGCRGGAYFGRCPSRLRAARVGSCAARNIVRPAHGSTLNLIMDISTAKCRAAHVHSAEASPGLNFETVELNLANKPSVDLQGGGSNGSDNATTESRAQVCQAVPAEAPKATDRRPGPLAQWGSDWRYDRQLHRYQPRPSPVGRHG
jgi:hypothetical protein